MPKLIEGSTRVSIEVSPLVHTALKHYCKESGVKVGVAVTRALSKFFNIEEVVVNPEDSGKKAVMQLPAK